MEYRAIYGTGTEVDVVWMEGRGINGTGMEMDVDWVECRGRSIRDGYGRGCSLDIILSYIHGMRMYRM